MDRQKALALFLAFSVLAASGAAVMVALRTLPNTPQPPTSTPDAWITLLSEDFERPDPGAAWQLSGVPTWGQTDYRSHGGRFSAYATSGGTGAVSPPGPYPNHAWSWMTFGPFSLVDAAKAELSFSAWIRTEHTSETKLDQFCAFASPDQRNFVGTCDSGDTTSGPDATNGWITHTLDLVQMDVLGQPQVWIAFVFASDDSVTDEGVYLDDIRVRACPAGR